MSSSPWVGCSCVPSPALITLLSIRSARNCAAPDAPWRMTTMSMRIASRFRAVSTRVSPFVTLDVVAATLTVSAESRFSANSNEMRVRVDDVRLDRQFAPAAIDEHGEGDAPWPPEVRQLVERGADGAAGVQHVVDDDHVLAVDVHRDSGRPDHRPRTHGLEVVAVERDVERALRNVDLFAFGDPRHDTRRELDAAA